MIFLLVCLFSYFLGSIPTAVWLGKAIYGKDVRNHGSRNSGATNTFRVLGKTAGIIVLFIDVFKGFLAVLLSQLLLSEKETSAIDIIIVGILCVIGHIFSIFINFHGGKGVATSLGVFVAINPLPALTCLMIFIIVFLITKYVSLASIISAFAIPLVSFLIFNQLEPITIVFNLIMASLVIFSHRKNIKRLLNGTELKMNLPNSKA